MSSLLPAYFLAFCRIVIGLLFCLSLIGKAANVPAFERTITGFGILPSSLSRMTALLFLGGELAVVVLVTAGGPLLGPGFLLAICLLLLFSVALVSVLARRIRTTCNCFGASEKLVSPYDVWRNVGLLLCALGGLAALTALHGAQSDLALVEWVLIGFGAAIFVVIWLNLQDVVQLFRQS